MYIQLWANYPSFNEKKSFLHVYIYMFLKKEKPETDDFEEKNFGSKQEILFK